MLCIEWRDETLKNKYVDFSLDFDIDIRKIIKSLEKL